MAVFTMNMIGVVDLIPPAISHLEDAQGNTVASLSVDENSAPGTVVGTVVADASAYSFAIVGGSTTFAISNAGQITVADNTALDYETTTSLSFQVTASDYANNVSSAFSVTVNILDIDDIPPTMTKPFTLASISEYPSSSATVVDFSAVETNGTNISSSIAISISPSDAGFSITNATNNGAAVKRVTANANQFLGGGVDRNTTFTVTATATGANGYSSGIVHVLEVTDISKITGGTYLGGPTAGQLANFEASNMSDYWDAAVNDQSKLYLMELNQYVSGSYETTYILDVSLANGSFTNAGVPRVITMPTIAAGNLGSISNHREIRHVWVSGSYFFALSDDDDHNGYDAPCLWYVSKTATNATWNLVGQPNNWTNNIAGPSGSFLGPNGRMYLYDRISGGAARYEEYVSWGILSAGTISGSNLPLNGIGDTTSFGTGVAVCSHSGNDTIILADNVDRVEVVDFAGASSGASTKVGDLVNVDDMDNLEAQITGAPSLNLGSRDALAGYSNYMYVFNYDSSHANDFGLYRFDVTNAHNSEP